MILLAYTKEFSKIAANMTMGLALKCAEVTTLWRAAYVGMVLRIASRK